MLGVVFLHTEAIADMFAGSHCGYIRLIDYVSLFSPHIAGRCVPRAEKEPSNGELNTMFSHYTLPFTTIALHN